MKPPGLQRHITQTYVNLRFGTAFMGLAFPVILWLAGRLLAELPLQSSMSDYYHTQIGSVFVGILFAIGSFLYLYRGFSSGENIALNFAGIFAIGIAVFPTASADPNLVRSDLFSLTFLAPYTAYLHGVCAVSFFLAIAYVCIFRAQESLRLIGNPAVALTYRSIYVALGVLMIAVPAVAACLAYFQQQIFGNENSVAVFFVEAGAVWVFSAYWLVKTWEFRGHPRHPGGVELAVFEAASAFEKGGDSGGETE